MAARYPRNTENIDSNKRISPEKQPRNPDPPVALRPRAPTFIMTPDPLLPLPFDRYEFNVPAYHPPYENPIDGRYGLHFDPSIELDSVWYPDGTRLGISKEIAGKVKDCLKSLTKPRIWASVEIYACSTYAARVTAAPNTTTAKSPPLFCFYIDADQVHRWREIYGPLKDLLEKEFPQDRYPECYPKGQMIIRFCVNEVDVNFASQGG